MAISAVHYQLLKEHAHLLKHGGSLLEIGEANWYGDMNPYEAMDGFDLTSVSGQNFLFQFDQEKNPLASPFTAAKALYRLLARIEDVTSVDLHGTDFALRQDLNGPLSLPRLYDVAINHGTAEHIFNIGMVFKSMHDYTKVGGVMIHECPFTGWVDHGFYTLQPGLFYDLAAANEYELISLSITEIQSRTIIRVESREHFHTFTEFPNNAMLYVVLRKTVDAPFRVPMQGIYGGQLSEKGREAWATLR